MSSCTSKATMRCSANTCSRLDIRLEARKSASRRQIREPECRRMGRAQPGRPHRPAPLCLLQPSLSGSHAPREAIAADQVASRPGADGCQRQLPGKLGKGRKERRMRTSAPQFVACEELVWIKADGSETEVVARVGAPYPDGDGAFFCPVELSGVDGRYPDIGGSGSLQSLCLAVRLLSTRLGHLLEDGERIVRPR